MSLILICSHQIVFLCNYMLVCHFFLVTKLSLYVVYQIVIFMKQSNCYYQIVTFLKLPNCRDQIVNLPNCHYQILLSKFTLPKILPSFATSYKYISIIVRQGMRTAKIYFQRIVLVNSKKIL